MIIVIQLVNLNSVLNPEAILKFGSSFTTSKTSWELGKEARILCLTICSPLPALSWRENYRLWPTK